MSAWHQRIPARACSDDGGFVIHMNKLSVTVGDRVATLTLNDAERRNPLGTEVVKELIDALRECDAKEDVGAIVLQGAGANFSAGADLQEFAAGLRDPAFRHWSTGQPWEELFGLVRSLGKPVIASVRGFALGGGCGLVALSDFAIASENATFGTPEINIGLFPLFILPALIRAVGQKNALYMCLSGERINAGEAQRLGLVNWVVPEGELEAATKATAKKFADKPPESMRLGKYAFYRIAELDYLEGIDFARTIRGSFLTGEGLRKGTERFLKRN